MATGRCDDFEMGFEGGVVLCGGVLQRWIEACALREML